MDKDIRENSCSLDRLGAVKALALVANTAEARPREWYNVLQIADGITFDEDAEFIAGCGPATVLELIAEVERMRAEVREWLCIDCNTVYPGPPQTGFACVMCPKCNGRTMPRLRAEVEKLKAELATLCRAEGAARKDSQGTGE